MLSSSGFDLWAEGYDQCVELSEEENSYPFAGYKKVLGTIYQKIREGNGRKVLDIGFGTGVLTQKLYQDGYQIYGMDFSEQMIRIAKTKMPEATLLMHDFSEGYPEAFEAERFDFIICTYAIHHLDMQQKISFINELRRHLSEGGKILLGDVAFDSRADMDACRVKSGDEWDEDEIYMIAEEMLPLFEQIAYEKITYCSGVFTIR